MKKSQLNLLKLKSQQELGTGTPAYPKLSVSWFWFGIAGSLVFILVSIGFLNALVQTKYRFDSRRDDLIASLGVLIASSRSDFNRDLDEVEKVLIDITKPYTDFIGTDYFIKNDIKDIRGVLQEWLLLTSPLRDYKFGMQGLVSQTDPNRYFTNDLEKVLINAPNLLLLTKRLWDKFWFYRTILYFSGSDSVRSSLTNIESLFKLADQLIINKDLVLKSLGHFSSQNIVIFNQNTGEARPTGGFIGSYIPMNLSKGILTIGQSQSIYYVDGQSKPFFPHPATWYYFRGEELGAPLDPPQSIRNTNYFPCFRDSAKLLHQEFERSANGFTASAIVFLTPTFISSLLPAETIVRVRNDLVFTIGNFQEVVERISSTEASNPNNPKSELTDVLNALLEVFINNIPNISIAALFQRILTLVLTRDIQVWFKDSDIYSFWNSFVVDSNSLCADQHPGKNIVTPLISNISGDKRNLVTQNQFNMFVENRKRSRLIHVKYKQLIPQNPVLQRGFQAGESFSFVGLQIPKLARNVTVFSPQARPLPFLKKYYQLSVLGQNQSVRTPSSIDKVLSSSRELYSQDGSIPGFVYQQPDDSQVIGIYIKDDLVSEVEFSFELPTDNQYLTFYSQPGLNKQSLSLGRSLQFGDYESDYISDSRKLQAGVVIQKR